MKHILIDGTTISKQMDGLSQYILNVTCRLPRHQDWQYHVVVRPEECPNFYQDAWRTRGMEIIPASIAPIGPLREWQFRQWLRSQRSFDAVLAPSNQYSIAIKAPSVYVVHDIIYERYPEQLGALAKLKQWWLHHNVSQGLKRAQKVIAVSQFTKQEILHFHPQTNADKIRVIYEGWEHLQQPVKETSIYIPFNNYILYIGSSRGHKNIQGLLNAIEIVKANISEEMGLVIVGNDRMLSSQQRAQLMKLKNKVLVTGWLNTDELDAYYRHAKAVIFPSLCEGFGIPALEAFYYHKPLLLSNASSLPEVAGDAAIYFDPTQPQQIADVMLQAWHMSENEQREWIKKGEKRLKTFSWQKTADGIDDIITELLNT